MPASILVISVRRTLLEIATMITSSSPMDSSTATALVISGAGAASACGIASSAAVM